MHETQEKSAAESHARAKSITSHTLPSLRSVKKEVKNYTRTLVEKRNKRDKARMKEQEEIRKATMAFGVALKGAKGTGGGEREKAGDPWLANMEVKMAFNAAAKGYHARRQDITDQLTSFQVFEASLIQNLKNILQSHYSWKDSEWSHPEEKSKPLLDVLTRFTAETEWTSFTSKHNTTLTTERWTEPYFEGMNDKMASILREGTLLKPKMMMKGWKEAYYVLSAAGWLHEFHGPVGDWEKIDLELQVVHSVFLGECTLSPLDLPEKKPLEFDIVEQREGGMLKKSSLKTYKLKGEDPAETKAWWNDIASKSRTTLAIADKSVPNTMVNSGSSSSLNTSTNDEKPTKERAPSDAATSKGGINTAASKDEKFKQEPASSDSHGAIKGGKVDDSPVVAAAAEVDGPPPAYTSERAANAPSQASQAGGKEKEGKTAKRTSTFMKKGLFGFGKKKKEESV
ncbi:hypothetical protein HK102_005231 [Quaeritorhiza haematococci]|nr:hypothetical protein HK102_005231 [Quaeritorhiza haematococci]